jgi:hypothetical protein
MINMKEENQESPLMDDETIEIFVPIKIIRKRGVALIIEPKNIKKEEGRKHIDENMIKTIAKAYKWKIMIDEGQVVSLGEIAEKEKITASYVSRVFNLNFLSPKIVERILNGTHPRELRLTDLINKEIPDLWQEQEENWGF